jgi:hypothetical protein
MSRRVRNRQQRSRLYYRVIRPDGTRTVISAGQFMANVSAGNLIRDSNDMRLARPRKLLKFTRERKTGELIFYSARSRTLTPPVTVDICPARSNDAGPQPHRAD